MTETLVILNNIGTPAFADKQAVKTYLTEFLMDKEVIQLPFLFRFLLVRGLIVPFRTKSSTLKYRSIWTLQGSPLLHHSEEFREQLAKRIPEFSFALGMNFGQPSLRTLFSKTQLSSFKSILFCPLFPQYADSTTGSASRLFSNLLTQTGYQGQVKILPPFYESEGFISYWVTQLSTQKRSEHLLFSYHGLPQAHVKKDSQCQMTNCCLEGQGYKRNCYLAQCKHTSELIAKRLGIDNHDYSVCFQSRLGPGRWLEPSLQETLDKLLSRGIKTIQVVSPSFVVDCLETLEEIGIVAKNHFLSNGGQEFNLISCPNADTSWSQEFAQWLKRQI